MKPGWGRKYIFFNLSELTDLFIIRKIPVRAVPGTLKLVEDAVVFVKGAQLAAEVIMDLQDGTQTHTHSYD